jgi:plasmid stabilization system protein ParE
VDYHLLFTQRALGDLSEIVRYIARDDDEAASRFGKALLDHVDLLSRFPRMGNTIRKRTRVRKLVHTPILVYYQIREEERMIEVLHFRHGSRKPPKFQGTNPSLS